MGPLASAELYDPATGIWTATGAMTVRRYVHTSIAPSQCEVLVAGEGSTAAELYNPATGV